MGYRPIRWSGYRAAVPLVATVLDPRSEPVPAQWDEFVEAQRVHSYWRAELLRAAAWFSQTPTYLVLVTEQASDRVLGLFHVRHLGLPGRMRGYSAQRKVRLGLAECRVYPNSSQTGSVLAAECEPAERTAVHRAFERGLRRRLRPTLSGIAYRQLTAEELAAVPRTGRVALPVVPSMVLENQWSDVGSYLAGLNRKWRSQLRKISSEVRTDPSITVAVEHTVPVDQAAWLIDIVRRRYARRGFALMPVGHDYLSRFIADDETRFVTYRDRSGRLLSLAALHDNGVELAATYWGNRLPADGGRANVYFDQYLQGVEYLIATGRKRLVMGKGMTDIKARYGCQPSPRWAVAGLA